MSFQIGEVIDGPDDGIKRPVHDGVQYDFGQAFERSYLAVFALFHFYLFFLLLIPQKSCESVFDVDIGDGEPIRKLPYNRSGTLCFYLKICFGNIIIVFFGQI